MFWAGETSPGTTIFSGGSIFWSVSCRQNMKWIPIEPSRTNLGIGHPLVRTSISDLNLKEIHCMCRLVSPWVFVESPMIFLRGVCYVDCNPWLNPGRGESDLGQAVGCPGKECYVDCRIPVSTMGPQIYDFGGPVSKKQSFLDGVKDEVKMK